MRRVKNTAVRKNSLKTAERTIVWTSKMEQVGIIRKGIPYSSIETISEKLGSSVKAVLSIVGMPQTTYNKNKKKSTEVLDSRDSELILHIAELLNYGLDVFNNEEEKFKRWLKKPNPSLGGNFPESLFDTLTGIDQVFHALNRIEHGNFA